MRKLVNFMLFIVVLFSCQTQEKKLQKYNEKAHHYNQIDEYENSLKYTTKALEINPNDQEALYYKIYALMMTEDYYKAVEYSRRIYLLDSTFFLPSLDLGTAYFYLKEYDSAVFYLSNAIRLNAECQFNFHYEVVSNNEVCNVIYLIRGYSNIRQNNLSQGCEDLKTAKQLGNIYADETIIKYCK